LSTTDSAISNTSVSEQSSLNLLEINRYLRNQKEQTEERYENLKLTAEINEQRLKTVENDLEFHKRQSQAYEADIGHLQGSIDKLKSQATFRDGGGAVAHQSATAQDNFELVMETNRRLKGEIDSLGGENGRVRAEVVALEGEVSELRAKLSGAAIKSVSLQGENNCMQVSALST
jgi:chromosome segregation ATPase